MDRVYVIDININQNGEAEQEPQASTTIADSVEPTTTTENVTKNTQEGTAKKQTKAEKEAEKAQKEKQKAISKGVALTTMAVNYAAQLYVTDRVTQHNIQGDYLAAQNMQRTYSNIKDIGGMASTIGLGFAFGGPVGGAVAAGAVALSMAQRAIQIAQETKTYIADSRKQQFNYTLSAQRLIRNYSNLR